MEHTKEQLLAMPYRTDENVSRQYTEILIIPLKTKHDSGFSNIAIIGIWKDENKQEHHEVCANQVDDISWLLPTITIGKGKNAFQMAAVRTDCYYPQGILRYHGRNGYFTVSYALSSIDITFTLTK